MEEEYGGGGLKDTVPPLVHDGSEDFVRWLKMPSASVHVSCLRALTLQINFSFQGFGLKRDLLLSYAFGNDLLRSLASILLLCFLFCLFTFVAIFNSVNISLLNPSDNEAMGEGEISWCAEAFVPR